jgi:hypothetical protein
MPAVNVKQVKNAELIREKNINHASRVGGGSELK